ncbi:MAG: HD domain-containing protein [Prolixibacteraceae bacterium]
MCKTEININEKDVHDLEDWFFHYVQTFKNGDKNVQENILLKENHTMQVGKEIFNIGKQLKLNNDELRLSKVMALFHDIGRFEQYARFKTFVDKKSVNHAELGVKILKDNKVLTRLDESMQHLILQTILYHNRASLPEKETDTCLFYTKLLRDADKLDIWRIVTDYYKQKNGKQNVALELDLPNTPGISDEVYQDLINMRIVDIKHIKNLNDFKLLQMGWVFDVNFDSTFHTIQSRHYIEMIADVLPESKEIQNIIRIVQLYLKQRTLIV